MSKAIEPEQLAEDILYLEYLINVEKNRIEERLVHTVRQAQSDEDKITLICRELSGSLAQMSARISVLEKLLVNGRNAVLPVSEHSSQPAGTGVEPPLQEVKVSIVDLGEENHLGNLYYTDNNKPYHIVLPGSQVVAQLNVDRSDKKALAINVVGTVDKDLLNSLQVIVDGEPLEHKFARVDGQNRLLAHLPVRSSNGLTVVKLVMPDSKGSLNLSDIFCVPRQSVANYLKAIVR